MLLAPVCGRTLLSHAAADNPPSLQAPHGRPFCRAHFPEIIVEAQHRREIPRRAKEEKAFTRRCDSGACACGSCGEETIDIDRSSRSNHPPAVTGQGAGVIPLADARCCHRITLATTSKFPLTVDLKIQTWLVIDNVDTLWTTTKTMVSSIRKTSPCARRVLSSCMHDIVMATEAGKPEREIRVHAGKGRYSRYVNVLKCTLERRCVHSLTASSAANRHPNCLHM